MSYAFKTKLLSPTAEVYVIGTFSPAEPETLNYPGCSAEFEIETITINDSEFEVECLCDETLKDIEDEAFKAASDELGDY